MAAMSPARIVVGYDVEGREVFRDETSHIGELANRSAKAQAAHLVSGARPEIAYAVILDTAGYVVAHAGSASCDQLLDLRDGQRFTVRGKVYAARTGGSEGRSYYCGDSERGPRSEQFRVPVWRRNGTAGHITVNARTKIRFPSEEY